MGKETGSPGRKGKGSRSISLTRLSCSHITSCWHHYLLPGAQLPLHQEGLFFPVVTRILPSSPGSCASPLQISSLWDSQDTGEFCSHKKTLIFRPPYFGLIFCQAKKKKLISHYTKKCLTLHCSEVSNGRSNQNVKYLAQHMFCLCSMFFFLVFFQDPAWTMKVNWSVPSGSHAVINSACNFSNKNSLQLWLFLVNFWPFCFEMEFLWKHWAAIKAADANGFTSSRHLMCPVPASKQAAAFTQGANL